MTGQGKIMLLDGKIIIYIRANLAQPLYSALLKFDNGPNVRKSLRTADPSTAQQRAVDAWHEIAHRYRRGLCAKPHTFGEACQALREQLTGWRIRDYNQTMERFLIPLWGDTSIDDIGSADIQDWIDWRRTYWTQGPGKDITHIEYLSRGHWVRRPARHVEPGICRLRAELSIIRHVLQWAHQRGWIKEVPSVPVPKAHVRRRPHFTLAEILKLRRFSHRRCLEAPHHHVGWERKILHHWVAILYLTGMRPVEANNLRWGDVEWDRCLWVKGKGKRRELVPMRPAWRHFRQLRTIVDGEKVFPHALRRAWTVLLEEAGLRCNPYGERRSPYSLRHTYATNMLAVRHVPIHTLAINMGTSVEMIERHYSHLTAHQARDLLE